MSRKMRIAVSLVVKQVSASGGRASMFVSHVVFRVGAYVYLQCVAGKVKSRI